MSTYTVHDSNGRVHKVSGVQGISFEGHTGVVKIVFFNTTDPAPTTQPLAMFTNPAAAILERDE